MAARVMICGAQDTQRLRDAARVSLRRIGADPFDYTRPAASPITDGLASNVGSSLTALERADLVVFILRAEYGQITWQHELTGALQFDKPALVFVHSETNSIHQMINAGNIDLDGIRNPGLRQLLASLAEFQTDANRRIFAFDDDFEAVFNEALAGMFEQLLINREQLKLVARDANRMAGLLDASQSRAASQQQEIASLRAIISSLQGEIARKPGMAYHTEPPTVRGQTTGPSRPRRTATALLVGALGILLLGAALGRNLTSDRSTSTSSTPVTTNSAQPPSTPVASTTAAEAALDGGLTCGATGWVTYYGLFNEQDRVAQAEGLRARLQALPNWDQEVSIHLSSAGSMCSTGFAIAYAQIPSDQVVLWSDPVASKQLAAVPCERIRGSKLGCFAAPNPERVIPR